MSALKKLYCWHFGHDLFVIARWKPSSEGGIERGEFKWFKWKEEKNEMKRRKSDLLKKIADLERRIIDLERKQPLVVPVPCPCQRPSLSVPNYPWYPPIFNTDGTKI